MEPKSNRGRMPLPLRRNEREKGGRGRKSTKRSRIKGCSFEMELVGYGN
jgi:hypothetical protein